MEQEENRSNHDFFGSLKQPIIYAPAARQLRQGNLKVKITLDIILWSKDFWNNFLPRSWLYVCGQ